MLEGAGPPCLSTPQESTIARASGLQIGDELLLIELLDDQKEVRKITSPAEMRELLQEERDEQAFLTFRSRAKAEDSNETVKKAVSQAENIAALLPTWKEIADSGKMSIQRGEYADLKEAILSRTFLFRAKCDMVQSLMSAGLSLLYDDFVPSALKLHAQFSPAPDSVLWTHFPKSENMEVRDELMIAQLDVLTNLWRNLPRIVTGQHVSMSLETHTVHLKSRKLDTACIHRLVCNKSLRKIEVTSVRNTSPRVLAMHCRQGEGGHARNHSDALPPRH